MRVQSLGQDDPLEEGMANHSSTLAWRIPWTEERGKLAHGVARSWARVAQVQSLHSGVPSSTLPQSH